MKRVIDITENLKANHHQLSAIFNRVDQAKREADQKEKDKKQGA
jgi:hypothetical protein